MYVNYILISNAQCVNKHFTPTLYIHCTCCVLLSHVNYYDDLLPTRPPLLSPTPDSGVQVSSDPGRGVIEAGQDIHLSLATAAALEDTSPAIQVSQLHQFRYFEAKTVFNVCVRRHGV